MATAKKLTDNYLTCVICTEVFLDPVTLQCNHTFCKSCLLEYTKTQFEAIQAKFIPCPSCRQRTKVTNPGSPVEEWVSPLKPSHVVQSLMDDFGPVTKAPETRECSICRKQQRQTPATSWCSSCDSLFCDGCLNIHGEGLFSRDHEVVELAESPNFKMTPKRQFKCKHHVSKQIELFCKDCKMAICTICCSINHRNCNEVDTIENMNPEVKEQLTKRTKELNVRIGNIKHGISVRKKQDDDFRNTIENAKYQIGNVRAKAVELIMKKEKQLLNDVDQSCAPYIHLIKTDIQCKEMKLQRYQQQYDVTVNAVNSSREMDMYALYESMDEAFTENRGKHTDNMPAPAQVVFTHNMDKLSKAVDELHLGDVSIVQDVFDPESVPALYQTIYCKRGRDSEHSGLSDVTVLTVDGVKVLVVVDCDNNRLHTYYTHDIQCPKYFQLSNTPWRITQLPKNQVAVSVPDSKEIVTVKVYPDPVILSTIETNYPYYGLACLSPSRLVAGATGTTDILDMNGVVLKSFNIRKVSTPSYVHVTGNQNLIVSHGLTKSLVSVTRSGKAVFTYTPTGDRSLKCPRGITSTNTGDILFADRDSNKVIQLTESGQFVSDVLTAQDGIDSPRGICTDTNGFLYVTSGNCVKVFKLDRSFHWFQMATAKKLTDNHLTCVICTEVYTDPVTLQCNHTFCKSCLLKYTKTQSEAIKAKFIPCPSCRQRTKVTNPGNPVEEWVSHLKPSHVIQGLMDDFGPGTEGFETGECSVCRNQQKKTPATSWCSSCDSFFCYGCLNLHEAMPLSRNHEVVILSESSKLKTASKRPFMCKHHSSKQIEFFCIDCNVAICTICCSIKHRKCDDVDTIEKMTPQIKGKLRKRTQELNVRIGNIKHGISAGKKQGEDFKNKIEEVKGQIRHTLSKVVKMIMRKEKQLLRDIDECSTQYLQQIYADIKSKEIQLQIYQQQYELTVNAVSSSCEMDMCVVYESVCGASLDSSFTDKRPAPARVVFTHNMDKLSKTVNELHLGDVKIVQDVCDRESVPTLYQTIYCNKGRDMTHHDCDVTVLAVDGMRVVVVADYDNMRLHTNYTSDIQCPTYIQLANGPWRITQLTDCQVAVSVPDGKEIVTVKVYPHLVKLSTIKTNRSYYGLASLSPSRLVAGSTGRTDILDMKGNVLKSIDTGQVATPSYIHVTGNRNLIVSHGMINSLESVTSEGKAVFTYTPTGDRSLKCPRGITSTSTGDILLADRDSHKVIQLTESGQFVRDVLTAQNGIRSPRGICLDPDGLLYVTCKNCVKVFSFQRH
ncbi:uncharacterized protein [Haliotis asinina]|uniref:uncharacterized protein n=1 Tax=Haliotis asinina TaxID=109174 RepID=UPI003531939E